MGSVGVSTRIPGGLVRLRPAARRAQDAAATTATTTAVAAGLAVALGWEPAGHSEVFFELVVHVVVAPFSSITALTAEAAAALASRQRRH